MPTYSYFKQTAVGTFRICPDGRKRWSLYIVYDDDAELLGTYSSPHLAADDVYMQNTGMHEWDSKTRADAPQDLSGWERQAVR